MSVNTIQEHVVVITASILSIKPRFGPSQKSNKIFGSSHGFGSFGRRWLFTNLFSKASSRPSTKVDSQGVSFVPLDGKVAREETSLEFVNRIAGLGEC